jgi:hypothetical protein
MDPMPITGNTKVDHLFAIVGIIMSASSTAASILNAKVRAVLDAGEEVPVVFLGLALAMNYAALNIDKAAQIHRLLKGGKVVVTRVGE